MSITIVTAFAASTLLAGCSKILGINDVTVGGDSPAPRLIAPLSMSMVTQQRPTLHWVLGTEDSAPIVDLCKDRACTTSLPITSKLAGDNLSAVPETALSPGWVFWRVRVVSGSETVSSATWQFWVGASSASNPVDTSNGAILDVNGDGFPDFLVGAYSANSGMGTVHLYLGSAMVSAADWNVTSTASRIDLTNPDGANASFGYSVTSAGDVNGDGFADFLIGAYGAGSDSGTAHLYLGSAAPSAKSWNMASTPDRIDLGSLDGEDAIFGAAVASAGDVNGDGYADFLVGASKTGVVHLYLGSAKPSATDWNGATLTARIDLTSPTMFAAFGNSVASAGDVNGDGYADFLIGADGANGAGAAGLYLGSATPDATAWNAATSTKRIDLSTPEGSNGSFGYSVAGAGDINGDGYTDFLVGAPSASSNSGAAHLYLGSAAPSAAGWNGSSPTGRIDLINPDGPSALFGSSAATAGDVNGDGFADFLVGAEGVSMGTGAAHLYLGAATPGATVWNGTTPSNRINLANPDGTGARFGTSVANAGDVNSDGLTDFLVGAHDAHSLDGAAHLYLGSMTPSTAAWSGAPSTGRMDVTNPDGANARFGVSVASGGNFTTTTVPVASLVAPVPAHVGNAAMFDSVALHDARFRFRTGSAWRSVNWWSRVRPCGG